MPLAYSLSISYQHKKDIIREALKILDEWLKKCDRLRSLDFMPNKMIEDDMKNMRQYLPPSKDNLKDQYKELYYILNLLHN